MTSTISTLQNKTSNAAFGAAQSKHTTAFTLQTRDLGRSALLKEDGGFLLTESGNEIILEQSVQGDGWTLQNRS